eukprot:6842887-Heterocapsa_arctica.AAC.1
MSSGIMLMTWFCLNKDTEEEAISGHYKYLMEAKNKLTEIGLVLNDRKEYTFVQRKTGERIWHQTCPDYKGR